MWYLGLKTSWSRDFCQFFSCLGIGKIFGLGKKSLGIGKFCVRKKVLVLVSENLVSEKKFSVSVSEYWSQIKCLGIGIGQIGGSAMDAMARQPEMQGKLQGSAIVLIAFVEAVALFAVVVSLIK